MSRRRGFEIKIRTGVRQDDRRLATVYNHVDRRDGWIHEQITYEDTGEVRVSKLYEPLRSHQGHGDARP